MHVTSSPGTVRVGRGGGEASTWASVGGAGVGVEGLDGAWSPWTVRKLLDDLYRRREQNRANYQDLNPIWPKIAVFSVGRNGHTISYRMDNTVRPGAQDQQSPSWAHERTHHDSADIWRSSDLHALGGAEGAEGAEGAAGAGGAGGATAAAPRGLPLWESATRTWVAGAVLLATFALIVRATEKCLEKKLFKRSRRESNEWPRTNVIATTQHDPVEIDLVSLAGMDDYPIHSSRNRVIDLPPPYSVCANRDANVPTSNDRASSVATSSFTTSNDDPNKPITLEEPPPPYSACQVRYFNPKDSLPSVHFLNRLRQNFFEARISGSGPSSTPDTQITPTVSTEAANTGNGCMENAEGAVGENSAQELVFENGRIVAKDELLDIVNAAVEGKSADAAGSEVVSCGSHNQPCNVRFVRTYKMYHLLK